MQYFDFTIFLGMTQNPDGSYQEEFDAPWSYNNPEYEDYSNYECPHTHMTLICMILTCREINRWK